MAEELGWGVEAFDKAFAEVFTQGMVKADFSARLVWIPKAIKHNPPGNPNIVKSWGTEFDLLPECDLKRDVFEAMKASIHALGEPFGKAFDQAFRKPSAKGLANQEQEQEPKQEHKQGEDPSSSGQGQDGGEPTKKAPKPKKQHGSEDDIKAAQWMWARVKAVDATAKEPNWVAWANDMRLMREQDGRTHRDACELFGWANADPFWKANILSPAKLREQWQKLSLKRQASSLGGRTGALNDAQLEFTNAAATAEARRLYLATRGGGDVIDAEVTEVGGGAPELEGET